MDRRNFITLLGGAVAAWPLSARAQQRALPVIGLLHTQSSDANPDQLRAFRQGLKEVGFVEGENVAFLYRSAQNQLDQLPAMAAELVRRQVAVIVTGGGLVAHSAAKSATTTIPIVFVTAADPVGRGLVASLAHPGGNLTGVNFLSLELAAKRLELLRALVPAAARLAVLVNPSNAPTTAITLRDVEPAARAIGLQIHVHNASTPREIDAAFATMARDRPDALFVGGEAFYNSRRVQLVHLASRHAIPASYSTREFAEVGGLMSYGSDVADADRQAGVYVGRILKGAKPAELPVVQSSKLELVINAQAARILDLEIPPQLLAIADEVIE
jgi:putative ABC transport system substrate-binding protein